MVYPDVIITSYPFICPSHPPLLPPSSPLLLPVVRVSCLVKIFAPGGDETICTRFSLSYFQHLSQAFLSVKAKASLACRRPSSSSMTPGETCKFSGCVQVCQVRALFSLTSHLQYTLGPYCKLSSSSAARDSSPSCSFFVICDVRILLPRTGSRNHLRRRELASQVLSIMSISC